MADATEPNAAPLHQDVVADFPRGLVALCGFLGVAAITAGVVLGVILVNN